MRQLEIRAAKREWSARSRDMAIVCAAAGAIGTSLWYVGWVLLPNAGALHVVLHENLEESLLLSDYRAVGVPGFLIPESVLREGDGAAHSFEIATLDHCGRPGATHLRVHYKGQLPDQLREAAGVWMTGHLRGGVLVADEVWPTCVGNYKFSQQPGCGDAKGRY